MGLAAGDSNEAYRLAAALKEGAHRRVQLFDGHRHGEDLCGWSARGALKFLQLLDLGDAEAVMHSCKGGESVETSGGVVVGAALMLVVGELSLVIWLRRGSSLF